MYDEETEFIDLYMNIGTVPEVMHGELDRMFKIIVEKGMENQIRGYDILIHLDDETSIHARGMSEGEMNK